VCIEYRNDRLPSEQRLVLDVQRRDDLESRLDHHLEPEEEQEEQRWLLLYVWEGLQISGPEVVTKSRQRRWCWRILDYG